MDRFEWQPRTAQSTTATVSQDSTRSFHYFRNTEVKGHAVTMKTVRVELPLSHTITGRNPYASSKKCASTKRGEMFYSARARVECQ